MLLKKKYSIRVNLSSDMSPDNTLKPAYTQFIPIWTTINWTVLIYVQEKNEVAHIDMQQLNI